MQILRKKILHFAKYMSKNNIEMCNMKIFRLVDHNYNYFVGEKKNLPLTLIMHNGFYNKLS